MSWKEWKTSQKREYFLIAPKKMQEIFFSHSFFHSDPFLLQKRSTDII